MNLTNAEIASLESLNDSDLTSLLRLMPKESAERLLGQMYQQQATKQEPGLPLSNAMRMRQVRAKGMEITIPAPLDPQRRTHALSHPEAFGEAYFNDRFFMAHAEHHRKMMEAICHVAQHGGDQAISAPRGEGKTTVATVCLLYAMLKGWVLFPVVVAQTGPHAERIFKDIKYQFEANQPLMEDFPEISVPVKHLEGAPQRGLTQRQDGKPTRIEWKANRALFPIVRCHDGTPSLYGGLALAYYGLDAAIRGLVINGKRPDFVLIDDPETRESAISPHQLETRQHSIDQDIAGLAGPTSRIARVMLCTIQNRRCLAFQYTDKTNKSSWSGQRFSILPEWPANRHMWDEYMAIRAKAQQDGDKEGRAATNYYIENREAMDEGAIVANPARYDKTVMADGWHVEISAIQYCFNLISDLGMEAFLTEYQNDPPLEDGPEGSGLTAYRVTASQNRYPRGEVPEQATFTTAGIDLGKYVCHWVQVGWLPDGIGTILDYGVAEVPGMAVQTSQQALEAALYKTLLQFRAEMLETPMPPVNVLVDSGGEFADVVYQFVSDVQEPFRASKGIGSNQYRPGKSTHKKPVGHHWFKTVQEQSGVWLYNLDTDYWKDFVHQRFLTPTLDEVGILQPATLSLYNDLGDRKRHFQFGHHIVAEEKRTEFVPGKGLKTYWYQTNRNNHWLDALAMACAGAGMFGVRIPVSTT